MDQSTTRLVEISLSGMKLRKELLGVSTLVSAYDVELLHGFEEFSGRVRLFVRLEEQLAVVGASEDE